jgi:hypothetical protein
VTAAVAQAKLAAQAAQYAENQLNLIKQMQESHQPPKQ